MVYYPHYHDSFSGSKKYIARHTKYGGMLMNENKEIIKIKKNKNGNVTDVMLEDGNVLPLNHAILMAKEDEIEGVTVVRGKNGGEFLKADPNGVMSDDLKDLPKFKN